MTTLSGALPAPAEHLGAAVDRLRGAPDVPPAATIAVPVNARGDLGNVRELIADLGRYRGGHAFELVLVINNYPADAPPPAIVELRSLGIRVEALPSVSRRPGEAICLAARMPGVRGASSPYVILFDADCRVPDPTSLLDWYVEQFRSGHELAYSRVDLSDVSPDWAVRARVWTHYASRWVKRVILQIPTTRGSNYGVRRDSMLRLYEQGVLADDLNVGPAVRWAKGRVAYSNDARHAVVTSGRMYTGGWRSLVRYLRYRLGYNIRTLPVRTDASRHTRRERDRIERYDYERDR